MSEKISVIVPCYNEQDALPLFYQELKTVLAGMDCDYELILVDDGSSDTTLQVMKKLAEADDRIIYLSFSRNFGKEAAMYAGFCNAAGDYVVVMDADLQHPPRLLPEMLRILRTEDCDNVGARREDREGEGALGNWLSQTFYKVINKASGVEIASGSTDFRLMKRSMADAVVRIAERGRFSKGIFEWVGFRTRWIPYPNVERVAGETKWSLRELMRYAMEGITAFSTSLLKAVTWTGAILLILSAAMLLFTIIRYGPGGGDLPGWSVTACIVLFVGGVQLLCLGVVGQYIAKIYTETKQRPHYIIADTNRRYEP